MQPVHIKGSNSSGEKIQSYIANRTFVVVSLNTFSQIYLLVRTHWWVWVVLLIKRCNGILTHSMVQKNHTTSRNGNILLNLKKKKKKHFSRKTAFWNQQYHFQSSTQIFTLKKPVRFLFISTLYHFQNLIEFFHHFYMYTNKQNI